MAKTDAMRRFGIWLGMMLLTATGVSAAPKYIPKILEDFLSWVFLKLPAQAQNAHNTAFNIYFRLMLFIIVYAFLYYGTKKTVIKDNNKIAGTIAFVISLASVALIPAKVLQGIFATYSVVVSILLGLLPILVLIWLLRKTTHPWFRTLCYVGVGVFGLFFASYIARAAGGGNGGPLYNEIANWVTIGSWVSLLAGVISMFTAAGGYVGQQAVSAMRNPSTIFTQPTTATPATHAASDARTAQQEVATTETAAQQTEARVNADISALERLEAMDVKALTDLLLYIRKVEAFLNKLIPAWPNLGNPQTAKKYLTEIVDQIKSGILNNYKFHEDSLKKMRTDCQDLNVSFGTLHKKMMAERSEYTRIIRDLKKDKAKDQIKIDAYELKLTEMEDAYFKGARSLDGRLTGSISRLARVSDRALYDSLKSAVQNLLYAGEHWTDTGGGERELLEAIKRFESAAHALDAQLKEEQEIITLTEEIKAWVVKGETIHAQVSALRTQSNEPTPPPTAPPGGAAPAAS